MKKRVLSSLSAGVGYETAVFFAAGIHGIPLSKTGYCRPVCRLSWTASAMVMYTRMPKETTDMHTG
ncbi:hypothetical protein ACE3MZ_02855 [Paenibacillus sp. WLX1005]|uniref:hypothetical protein n=1 Tax=Paenibacillus sp. WLX1005 TaxID=3243766 RepID=UPI003984581F